MAGDPVGRCARTQWLLAALLLVACGLQLAEVRFRSIDPDEFEHLHAACLVARGQVPYRDYFEHHGPLLYYAMQPLIRAYGPELGALWWARAVMWGCSLGTLALTARLAKRIGGNVCGLATAALLAWTSIFHLKGIELRPDVPSMLLTVLAVSATIGQSSARRWLIAGALAGLATVFTQKAIVPVIGLACAGTIRELIVGNARQAFIPAGALAIGGALVWGAAFAAFGIVGAADDLWHGTVVQLIVWQNRSPWWLHLRPTVAADLAVWIVGGIEIVAGLRAFRDREDWQSGRNTVVVIAAFSILSVGSVKATFPQFYLLWFPFLALLAACRLVGWSRSAPSWSTRAGTLVVATAVAVGQLWLWRRAWGLGDAGPLPSLVDALHHGSIVGAALVPAMILLVLAATGWLIMRRSPGGAVLMLGILGMFHAGLRSVDAALHTNGEQVRRVEVVNQRVAPDETVFDGFTGYGALRPHAYYFWWINEYSLALMTPEQREGELLETLRRSPPAAILFDEHLALLPEPVTTWIVAHYAPLDDEPWLWMARHAVR